MKQIWKQLGAVLLAAALIVGMSPVFGGAAYAEGDDIDAPTNAHFVVTKSDAGVISSVQVAWNPIEETDVSYVVRLWSASYGDEEPYYIISQKGEVDTFDVSDCVLNKWSGGGDTWYFEVYVIQANGEESEYVRSEELDTSYLWFDPMGNGEYAPVVLQRGSAIAPAVAEIVNDRYYDEDTGSYRCGGDTLLAVTANYPDSDHYGTLDEIYADAYWANGVAAVQNTATNKSVDAYAIWDSDICSEGLFHKWEFVYHKATFTKFGYQTRVCSKCGKEDDDIAVGGAPIDNVKVAKTSYTYTGKAIKPTVTVASKSDGPLEKEYYKLTYSNNTNVGTAKVKITLQGEYFTGIKTLTYKINPKGTTLKTPAAAKKAATIKWNKQAAKMKTSRISGYQIMLATNSKFTTGKKTVNVAGYSKVSKKVTGLKGGKKYYVRIRTYKTVSGVKYYSPWSKTKTVTTKK